MCLNREIGVERGLGLIVEIGQMMGVAPDRRLVTLNFVGLNMVRDEN